MILPALQSSPCSPPALLAMQVLSDLAYEHPANSKRIVEEAEVVSSCCALLLGPRSSPGPRAAARLLCNCATAADAPPAPAPPPKGKLLGRAKPRLGGGGKQSYAWQKIAEINASAISIALTVLSEAPPRPRPVSAPAYR